MARISSNGAITLNAAAGIEAFIAYGDGLGSDDRDFSQVLANQITIGGKNQSLDFEDLAVGVRLSASNDININGEDSLVLNGGDAVAFSATCLWPKNTSWCDTSGCNAA